MLIDLDKLNPGETGFLLVRVGSDNRPATSVDLQDIAESLKGIKVLENRDVFVTHHRVYMDWIDSSGKARTTSNDRPQDNPPLLGDELDQFIAHQSVEIDDQYDN